MFESIDTLDSGYLVAVKGETIVNGKKWIICQNRKISGYVDSTLVINYIK